MTHTETTTPATPPATVTTITGRRVRLADGRVGVVVSAYGTSAGVDAIDVEITERTGARISSAVRRQRLVADLAVEDVTVL